MSGKTLTILLIAILALVGSIALIFATRWGIGTSPDSVAYIGAARNIVRGDGFSSHVTLTPITHFAPFYSFLLSVMGVVGVDPMIGAKWLNVLVFGINIFLVGFITISFTRRFYWIAFVAAFLAATSVPMITIHLMAWTEAVFLFFTFLGLFSLAKYFANTQRWFLIATALFVGLAFLTRYAGAALVLSGGLSILFFAKSWRRKIIDLLIFGVLSTLPIFTWMIRNRFAAGTATSRDIFFHPINWTHFWEFLYTTSRWVLLPDSAPNIFRYGFWLAIFAGIILVIYLRREKINKDTSFNSIPYIIKVVAIFLLVYGFFLATSISLLDANTPLDDRILSPAYIAGLILLMYLVYEILDFAGKKPILYSALLLIIVGFSLVHAIRGMNHLADGYHHGIGFSSLAWQQSDMWQQIDQLPADAPLFSNSPEAIYVNTGRVASRMPRSVFKTSQQINENYSSSLNKMKEQIKNQNGFLIYFSLFQIEASRPDQSITEDLSLLWQTDEGTIYVAGNSK